MDEQAAILAYQRGDTSAFRVLFELHVAHVYHTALLIMRDATRAEDVAQETFLILAQRLPSLIPGPLHSWLGRVAANLSLNERRRAREIPLGTLPAARSDLVGLGGWVAGPDVAVVAAEEQAALRAAIAALAPRQRAVIVLRYFGDCSLDEIAVALDCRPGTVRATLHQALQRLRATELRAAGSARPIERALSPGAAQNSVLAKGDTGHDR